MSKFKHLEGAQCKDLNDITHSDAQERDNPNRIAVGAEKYVHQLALSFLEQEPCLEAWRLRSLCRSFTRLQRTLLVPRIHTHLRWTARKMPQRFLLSTLKTVSLLGAGKASS